MKKFPHSKAYGWWATLVFQLLIWTTAQFDWKKSPNELSILMPLTDGNDEAENIAAAFGVDKGASLNKKSTEKYWIAFI